MKLTRRTMRGLALFFLADTLLNIVSPALSYALTTGPNQVEFTSYEPVGTTDMVNLITGDFTYNVPLIEVPSPEGGFTLPLSYHSGIGLEDEASWAGLGWNVNAGSISRTKVSNADDDYDNVTSINVQDPGGSGYVKNYMLYQRSWDSEKGYGGAINLLDVAGFSWNDQSGLQSGTVMGATFKHGKATFDVGQFFNGLSTVASFGASSAAASAATRAGGGTLAASAATTLQWGSTGMDLVMTSVGLYGTYKSQGSTSSMVGSWSVEKSSSYMGFRQDYKYWLDATRNEHSYGALYLGKMQANASVNPSTTWGQDRADWPRVGVPGNSAPAVPFPQPIYNATNMHALTSDMYAYVEPGTEYPWSFNPTHVAYDAYSVMGPGIGGSMAPYRPDIGSLNFPKRLAHGSSKVNLVPFLEEGADIAKIQFKYNGDLSNSYGYHDSGGAGMTISSNENGGAYAGPNGSDARRVYYQVNDVKLATSSQRTEADRDGLYNKRIAQGKHVEWFSNEEMATANGPVQQGKVMEYASPNDPTASITPSVNRNTVWPAKGIGAYAITNADGTTYHYALPVYSKKQEDFTAVSSDITRKFSRSNSGDSYNNRVAHTEWYATTWLLTGITGPDFVDQGEIGVIDAADLGYWVKLDYGRFANFYQWRFPYVAYTEDDGHSSYSKGTKETYYLNTIQTRTHTALFLKEIRKDGRAAYAPRLTNGTVPQWATFDDYEYPASSLALSEIVLLNNADFQQLQTNGFTKNSTLGGTIDNTQLNSSSANYNLCSLTNVYDVYDVQASPTFRSFLDQKAERKITLNTSYTLCPGTINSFASAATPPPLDVANASTLSANRMGKLTLNSVSYYGPNNAKLFPDFKFQYQSPNPAYNKNAWDGWGSYNATGASSHYSYASDPTTWHLTDIISPLGGRITVAYESDDYSSISGQPIRQQVPITRLQRISPNRGTLYFDLRNIAPLTLPQVVGSTATFKDFHNIQTQECADWFGEWYPELEYAIPSTAAVQSLQYDHFTITGPPTDAGYGGTFNWCDQGYWLRSSGSLEVTLPTKRGGGARVASLTVRDEADNAYRTGYIYTQTGQRNGLTSGVVAQEPDLVRTADYPFYHLYDFPNTPVLYAKVTVLDGMKSDTDFTHKTEYTFNTPDQNCVQKSVTQVAQNNLNWSRPPAPVIDNSKLFYFDIQNRSSRVGRVERIKTIDHDGSVVGNIKFDFTDQLPQNQGKFTSGSIMAEVANTTPGSPEYFKLSRTSITNYPSVLQQISTTSNGVTTTKRNVAWDFLTGAVTQEETTDATGQKFQTKVVPAYSKYPAMRSKAENTANKQMLTQTAATYKYKLNTSGNPVSVVTAGVQTWNKDWSTYRTFSATNDRYQAETSPVEVWRKHKSFVWNDNQLNAEGTTSNNNFTEYNWGATAVQAAKWLKSSEVTAYDHFSRSLEVKDLNGDFVTNKYGYNQQQLLAQSTNAKYTELAYSGAEDVTTWGHFGGEVRGGAQRDDLHHHTGSFSSKLTPTQYGFTYKATVGSEITAGRTYRLSAWLHASDYGQANGRLYASLNGNALSETRINSSSTKKAGQWYLLTVDVPVPSNTSGQELVVGCHNASSNLNDPAVYFDDFRFHPLDAKMTSYVYDTQSWHNTDVLDNNNLFTHYEYDTRGVLHRIYKEVLDRPNEAVQPKRLVKEYVYNYARNATFTVQANQVGTGQLTSSLPGGLVNLVENYGEVRYTAVSNPGDCSSLFNLQEPDAVKIDGVNTGTDRTLADGTKVKILPDGCILTNVRGPHVVELKFTSYTWDPVNTKIYGQCEVCQATGDNTGMIPYQLADGCGGMINNGEWRSESNLNLCPRPQRPGPIEECPVYLAPSSGTKKSETLRATPTKTTNPTLKAKGREAQGW